MLNWLKKRAAKQSLFNVEINARTLIVVSNKAETSIAETGATTPKLIEKVVSAQKSLLGCIYLALANGASFEEVCTRIDVAKSKESLSLGAKLAIENVVNTIASQQWLGF
jgi:hypothetical protein